MFSERSLPHDPHEAARGLPKVARFLIDNVGIWPSVAHAIAALVACVLVIHVVAVGALIFIWLERKVSGRIQDRLGPTRVGGAFGWLQTLADGIKLISKEDITPGDADRMLFKLAPYVSFAASFAAFVALPFSAHWVASNVNCGVFLVLAILGLEVFGVILAGYASGSKWSLFGAMREAAQVVSYEVPMGMCVVIPVLLVGSMDLIKIGEWQAGWGSNWLIFHDPFSFLVFWVYITCAVASVNRAPFDLAEAESELVAGFHTEYSGLRWSFFFMAEYGSMFLVSALAAILFLGGWNGPVPVTYLIASLAEATNTFTYEATGLWNIGHPLWVYLADLVGCANLILKATLGVIAMIWVRWTLPRLRIDQVMTTCLKYCVPLAAFFFIGVIGWQTGGFGALGGALPSPNDIAPARSRVAVREAWVRSAMAETADNPSSEAVDEEPVEPPPAQASEKPSTDAMASDETGGAS